MNRIVGRCDRIALHVPTGRRYLVQEVKRNEDGTGIVFCWGEVEAFDDLRTYHGPSLQLPLHDCQIAPCFKDRQLVTELAIQGCEVAGKRYWFRGSNGQMCIEKGPQRREPNGPNFRAAMGSLHNLFKRRRRNR